MIAMIPSESSPLNNFRGVLNLIYKNIIVYFVEWCDVFAKFTVMKKYSMLINLISFIMNVSQIVSVSRQSKLMGDNACSSLSMPMVTDMWIIRYTFN
jgi:hypothetical protein